jgi:glycosyltransferase involved in cell wall biosynthesis
LKNIDRYILGKNMMIRESKIIHRVATLSQQKQYNRVNVTVGNPLIRVLMFVPQYPYPVVGGLERQAHELSKALRKSGVDVQILSGKITNNHPSLEQVEGVPVTRLPWSSWKPARFMRSPFEVFFALWKRRKYFDIIHLHQHSWVGLFVILAAKVLKKPVLTKLPNVGNFGIPGLQRKRFGKLRKSILLRSDAFVAMSQESRDELVDVGCSLKRILTVTNGIQLLPKNQSIPDDNSAKKKTYRSVFAGRISSEKNLEVLIQAWSIVQKKVHFSCQLEIWGNGPQRIELEQLCSKMKLQDSVLFPGFVSNVRQNLRDVDVFVLPSLFEGNSNAVLEAMEAGLPIVATPVGGTAMQVGPEGRSLLFPVGDSLALADRLIQLIDDPHLRRHFGEAMAKRVKVYFDIDKIAEIYLRAYRTMVTDSHNLSTCGRLP